MLEKFRNIFGSSRKLRGPVIEKWEVFERYSLALIGVGISTMIVSTLENVAVPGLMLVGGFTGCMICASYYFMMTENISGAAGAATLVAAIGAGAAVAYIALPIWIIFLNGVAGAISTLGLLAIFTRRL